MNSLNENIRPYQSCSKSVFLVLGIIFISWISLFSIFLIVQGAWPVSIFLGLEYLIIFYLIRLYFKEKNIKDEININQKEISIRKYKGDKLLHSSKFNTYWSKVFFTKLNKIFFDVFKLELIVVVSKISPISPKPLLPFTDLVLVNNLPAAIL